jgi:Fe2+ transport system protein FeoA
MTLSDAKIGKTYFISDIKAGQYRRRLLDMGFTRGAEIFVSHKAPFGGTVLVGLRGFTVALRENAAGEICLSEDCGMKNEEGGGNGDGI